MAIFTGILAL